MRNRAAAAAKDRDIVRPFLLQLPNDFGKELDVAAVVTGNADGRDVLLNGGAYDVANIAMKPR